MLIDTHCHVHFNAYKDDMDEVITRALSQGVFMITVGTQSTTSRNGLAVAEKYDGIWATIGLHPNHLCEQEFYDADELAPEHQATPKIKTRCETFDPTYYRDLAKHPKCVAIGECGLDYFRLPETEDRDEVIGRQQTTVRAHFDLATEVNLPVVIHCRDAHADQLEIIREYVTAGKLQRRGVVHCFSGSLKEAHAYLELGFLLSFTGVITFPPTKKELSSQIVPPLGGGTKQSRSALQDVVAAIPLESIMVETDSPYLTPVPYRGKRNEPAHVRHVAEKIAELKGIPVADVERQTTENAKRLFRI